MSGVVIDGASLLAQIDGTSTLAAAEAALSREGLTLGLDGAPMTSTIAVWIGDGTPGAPSPWLDPTDHLIAGLEATLPNGEKLSIRPAPRRAVGPDLMTLFVGTRGRFGRIERIWLRVHPRDANRASPHPFTIEQPRPTEAEQKLFDAIAREMEKNDLRTH